MIIERMEDRRLYVKCQLEITEEYLRGFNKAFKTYNNAGPDMGEVTAEDIANAMNGVTNERLVTEIVHKCGDYEPWRTPFITLIREWIDEDFYDYANEEIIDGIYDVVSINVIES